MNTKYGDELNNAKTFAWKSIVSLYDSRKSVERSLLESAEAPAMGEDAPAPREEEDAGCKPEHCESVRIFESDSKPLPTPPDPGRPRALRPPSADGSATLGAPPAVVPGTVPGAVPGTVPG